MTTVSLTPVSVVVILLGLAFVCYTVGKMQGENERRNSLDDDSIGIATVLILFFIGAVLIIEGLSR